MIYLIKNKNNLQLKLIDQAGYYFLDDYISIWCFTVYKKLYGCITALPKNN